MDLNLLMHLIFLRVVNIIFFFSGVVLNAILMILPTILLIISANDLGIFPEVALAIFMVIFIPPFIFFNYKLFMISRKMRQQNAVSPEKRRISLKNINTCLLAVACLVFFSVPMSFSIVVGLFEGTKSNSATVTGVWTTTAYAMSCSFNSLIFFWKNKLLRDEGIKIINQIKDRVLRS